MRKGLWGAAGSASLLASLAAPLGAAHADEVRMFLRPVAVYPVNGQATVWARQTSPDLFEEVVEPATADERQSPDVIVNLSPKEVQDIKQMATSDSASAQKLVEQKVGPLDKALKGLDCDPKKLDPLAGRDDPSLPLVACSIDGTEKFVLEPSVIESDEVVSACQEFDNQRGAWVVNLVFSPQAQQTWSNYTAGHVGRQIAVTVDSRVVSHPVIQGVINGSTQISGDFTNAVATEFAQALGGCHV